MLQKSTRSLRALGAAVTLMFGLTAFGSQAQAGEVLQRILSSGKLRASTMASLPPYTNMNPSGQLEGYDIDLVKGLAAALKVEAEFIVVDSAGRVAALQTGKSDITMSGMARNITRAMTIAFSDPYLIVPGRVLVKANSPLKHIDEVNDPKWKMSMNRGGNSEPIIAARFPKANRLLFNANADCLNALMSDQVDAMAQDFFYLTEQMNKRPGMFRVLEGNYSRQENSAGLPAGDADWLRVVNLYLSEMNTSGRNAALFKKWFGFDPPRIMPDY
jgi:polar amino acid transport system substrate-binding protein